MERTRETPDPLSVLVVDDDADTTDSLVTVLRMYGFAARGAGCGPAALQEAAAEPPDAVVLDIHMPGMDGWELARRLANRARPPLIVAVTGCAGDGDRHRSAEAGVHLHLVKPVEPALLAGLLGRFHRVVAPTIPVESAPRSSRDGFTHPDRDPF